MLILKYPVFLFVPFQLPLAEILRFHLGLRGKGEVIVVLKPPKEVID